MIMSMPYNNLKKLARTERGPSLGNKVTIKLKNLYEFKRYRMMHTKQYAKLFIYILKITEATQYTGYLNLMQN